MANTIKQAEKTSTSGSFGETIRKLRKERGLTQAELAEVIGVDESYVSKIETGRLTYTPSEETLRLMAHALGADVLEVLGLAKKAPQELRELAGSQPARQFLEMVREQQLSNEDWNDLTQRLRRRIAKRQRGG